MRILLSVLAMVLTVQAGAQEGIDRTFLRRYNYGGMQGGLALTTTEDGGFIATGQHEGNGSAGSCDIYVYKVDACGNRIWFRLFGTGASEGGRSIEATPDGGFIIGGHGSSGLLLKLDAEGQAEWYHTYPAVDWVFDAIPLADGGYAAIGRQSGRPVIFKVDEDGLVLWAKRYEGFHDMPLSLSELSNGDMLFVANEVGVGRDVDVARVDDEGEPVWMRRYGGGFNDEDHTSWGCNALVDEAEGVAYVTSPTTLGSMAAENILVMQLDLDDGEPIWSKAFGSNGGDQSRDLTRTSTGVAIVGNTSGFPTSVDDAPDQLTENKGERVVLMSHMYSDGELDWAQTYGGNSRDKGIGVRFDQADGFTISAYTSSGVFGNGDDSMDPLFIRTDTVGHVNCQSASVLLQSEDVGVDPVEAGSATDIAMSASSLAHQVNEIEPLDTYQCQVCYTEPLFEWSTNQVCVGEPVEFYNTTQVGLTCFQEWELEGPEIPNGIQFPGASDTISYVFNVPGDYTMTLRSVCDSSDEYFIIPLFVHEVQLEALELEDYNGFEVSCPENEDGGAEGTASGGSSDPNYQWQWTLNGQVLSEDEATIEGLGTGVLEAVVFDYLGCSDTAWAELVAPEPVEFAAAPLNQYSGYPVSCPGLSDGAIQIGAITGGVGGYSSLALEGEDMMPLYGLGVGSYLVQVEDANGCTATDSVTLFAPPPPTLQLEGRMDSCETGNGGIDATYLCGVPPCSLVWPEGVGESMTVNALNQRLDGLGAGTYTVAVVDGNGCAIEASVEVEQTRMPHPDLQVNPLQGCGPDLEVTIEETGDNEVLLRRFDFGDGEGVDTFGDDSLGVRRHVHRYDEPGLYLIEVELTNLDGCTDIATEVLSVEEGLTLYAPNAFTPGNDGFNDGWRVEGAGVETFHLTITNRWGELMFETDDMERYWNGSPRGDGLSHMNDLFVYMIEATGLCEDFERLTGTIMLVR